MADNIVNTGIHGLDDVLRGGLSRGSTVILEGTPGSGKTTLAFQFLHHGVKVCNEPGIYVTFEELPSQLYSDMGQFGWDIRQLEKNNQMRVICISPESMLDQMLEPDGLFDQMVDEIGCKRIVVDSITLFRYGMAQEAEHRKVIYQLRNILRKKNLTSLLIREQSEVQTNRIPFEHFVADGVIRLRVKPQLERYRERSLEVLKMRGRNFLEGEHAYRITEEGIHLIPALHILDGSVGTQPQEYITTGIPRLDKILGGGLPRGNVFMFDTNSKSDSKHLFGSIVAAQLKHEQKVVMLSSTLSTLYEKDNLYRMHGVSAQEMIDQKRLFFLGAL